MSHDPTSDGVPTPTARFEVVRGGPATAEQVAATVVALTPVAADTADEPASAAPAWARAGLLEGVGLLPPTRPSDLQRIAILG